jgi:Xaa-Pro aminopeptidase
MFSSRLRQVRQLLRRKSLDALLVTHLPNIRYLCGFSGSSAALVISEKRALFFSDGRYAAQARSEVEGFRIRIEHEPPLIAAAKWLAEKRGSRFNGTRLAIEADHISVAALKQLKGTLHGFRIVSESGLVESYRTIKSEEEIDRLRDAARLGCELFEVAVETVRPGVRETDVAAEMEYAARERGAEAMSFETIVAAGPRSALPHGRASASRIPRAGFVVLDFGVILAGYCSDMTRTLWVGRPNPAAREAYEAVREAQQAAVDAVREGVSAHEVDEAARKLLRAKGMGRFFTHSTGHGIGLEIHEVPRIAAGSSRVLRSGMVVTVEPGVYIPGRWGVRIEDTVVVRPDGHEVLTPVSRELILI